jgi:hypothetical protein
VRGVLGTWGAKGHERLRGHEGLWDRGYEDIEGLRGHEGDCRDMQGVPGLEVSHGSVRGAMVLGTALTWVIWRPQRHLLGFLWSQSPLELVHH